MKRTWPEKFTPFICPRPADAFRRPVPGSVSRQCFECEQVILVSPNTVRLMGGCDVALTVCNDCWTRYSDETGSESVLFQLNPPDPSNPKSRAVKWNGVIDGVDLHESLYIADARTAAPLAIEIHGTEGQFIPLFSSLEKLQAAVKVMDPDRRWPSILILKLENTEAFCMVMKESKLRIMYDPFFSGNFTTWKEIVECEEGWKFVKNR